MVEERRTQVERCCHGSYGDKQRHDERQAQEEEADEARRGNGMQDAEEDEGLRKGEPGGDADGGRREPDLAETDEEGAGAKPLPVVVTLLAAAAAVSAPLYLRAPFFDHPALWWLGLSVNVPRSNDYVPLLPWIAPVLLGIALARLFVASPLPERLAGYGTATKVRWKTLLEQAGRHSLAIYLIHQPLLIALVYGFSLVAPAPAADPVAGYTKSCMRACEGERDNGFCQRFCGCTLDRLTGENLFADLNRGAIDVTTDERIAAISSQCTADAETGTDLKE